MPGTRLDLHIHTTASPDSLLTVEEVFRDALVQGLGGVAITDHNSVAALARARRAFEGTRGFLLVPGVEVSTREGHLLVYGVERAPAPHRPLVETLEEVRRLNGIPVLAHPFRWAHGAGRKVANAAQVAGIEGMNGRNSDVPNAKAGLVATRRHLTVTGGSDAHERGSVGRCYTETEEDVESVEDFLELLRNGRVRAEGRSQNLVGRAKISATNAFKRVLRGFSQV